MACLKSLVRQKQIAFELIGVDDGSTDDSADIFESMAPSFQSCVLLRTPGIGLVGALNLGARAAEGAILARADGDDVYHPMRLFLQIEQMEADGADLAGTLTRFFPRSRLQGGFRAYEGWINGLRTRADMEREIFVENPIPHPALAVRRSLFDRLNGYRDMGWPEDWDFVLRAHHAGARMTKLDRCLHYWREHPGRLCRVDARYDQEAFIRCRCHHLARGPLAAGRSVIIWGAGPIGRKMATHLQRENIAVEAFVDIDPRKVGRIVRGRPVKAPAFLKTHRRFVLGCVGQRGARYTVRRSLLQMGYAEGGDFILAA